MNNRVPEELITSPVFLLKRLGMKAKEESTDAYADAGVHPYHYAILATLAEGERETQGAIADALDYDRGQLVGLLDELEEQGLVERRRDPDDRRRQVVVMTAEGKRTLAKLRALARKLDDAFLAPLDAKQRDQLQRLLLALAQEHVPNCRLTGATLVDGSAVAR
ncbi:MAG TPA: MarR family winged helix-turn-helix transcriptional regulator [Gaiellaceae bacterium]|jgi:DNA-binding MarR family transcriptional regulator